MSQKLSFFSLIALNLLFLNKDYLISNSSIFLWPLISITQVIVDKMFVVNKLVHEFSFGILLIQTEIMIISGALSKSQYYFMKCGYLLSLIGFILMFIVFLLEENVFFHSWLLLFYSQYEYLYLIVRFPLCSISLLY